MRKKSFRAPPFVVWRVADRSKLKERFHCRLAPHGVFGNVLFQAVSQWVVLTGVLVCYKTTWLSCAALSAFSLLLIILLALSCNVALLGVLNMRQIQPVAALLQRSPERALKHYIAAFPTIIARDATDEAPVPEYVVEEGGSEPRLRRPWSITLQTAWYFCTMRFFRFENRPPYFIERRITRFRRWRGHRPRSEQFQENMSRLRALTLRREDSPLQAFSEFAILSCFVPITRKTGTSVPPIEAQFIAVYFAPILFGFSLCILTFALFAAKASVVGDWVGLSRHSHFIHDDKFAFMLCVFVWFMQGTYYAVRTLDEDFKSIFYNYFQRQRFPKSMTQFASDVIGRAPDLAATARQYWVHTVITAGMLGLAELYASFLHNLHLPVPLP